MLCYAQVLAECYAFKTVKAYVSDVYWYQLQKHQYLGADFFDQSFKRVSMLIKAVGKFEPEHKELKRPWSKVYFRRIAKGTGWSKLLWWQWASVDFELRMTWMTMVASRELLLRIMETCQFAIARRSDMRPWSRAHVTFWAGDRRILIGPDGVPEQLDFNRLTHVTLRDQPSKTPASGDREPYVCYVLSGERVREVNSDLPAWLVQTGTLLWLEFTINPIRADMAPYTPLFASRAGELGVTRQKHKVYTKHFKSLCKQASPRIPELDGRNRRLTDHCFRVDGTNAASDAGADLSTVAAKGKWSAASFLAHKGHDYLRTNHHRIMEVSLKMTVGVLLVPGANAWWDSSTLVIRTDWAVEALTVAAAGGFILAVLLSSCVCFLLKQTPVAAVIEIPVAGMVGDAHRQEVQDLLPVPSAPPMPVELLEPNSQDREAWMRWNHRRLQGHVRRRAVGKSRTQTMQSSRSRGQGTSHR